MTMNISKLGLVDRQKVPMINTAIGADKQNSILNS